VWEPANLGIKGQQATSRPPKPLNTDDSYNVSQKKSFFLWDPTKSGTNLLLFQWKLLQFTFRLREPVSSANKFQSTYPAFYTSISLSYVSKRTSSCTQMLSELTRLTVHCLEQSASLCTKSYFMGSQKKRKLQNQKFLYHV
jgi:hypothetical protein